MAYDRDDPRSQLSTVGAAPGVNVAPQYVELGGSAPGESTAGGSRIWWGRSQACVFAYARLATGDRFERRDQPDEWVVLVTEPGAVVRFGAVPGGDGPGGGPVGDGGGPVDAVGPALVVLPPGGSWLAAVDGPGGGGGVEVVGLFTSRSLDLAARAVNDGFYATPDPNVARFEPWPDPVDGFRIRVYPVDDAPIDPARFGRIYRCSTFMVNWLAPVQGPRDPARLSPHHHDDFEQLSLQVAGDYVHHIRTPWSTDRGRWRDDEHRRCASPAVTVIPPPAIHTSEAVGDHAHQLIDVFCPPRADFSDREGWVLNAAEYPAPGTGPDRGPEVGEGPVRGGG